MINNRIYSLQILAYTCRGDALSKRRTTCLLLPRIGVQVG